MRRVSFLLWAGLAVACGGSSSDGGAVDGGAGTSGASSGGSSGIGGSSGKGGASATGGVSGNGGASATGGVSGNGGASATGGVSGNGGFSATGGVAGGSATGGVGGVSGMSGGGGASGGGGSGGTPSTDCQQYASVVCNKVLTCLPKLALLSGPLSTCTSNIADSCTQDLTLAGSTLDANKIAACASTYQTMACDQLFYGGGYLACQSIGTLPDAASCVRNIQCQSGICEEQSDNGCGTCEALPGLGQTCTINCDPGLICDGGSCKTQAFLGQNCGGTTACASPMTCVAGKCQKSATSGPCSTYKDCDFWQGAWCTGGQCTQMTIAKLGETCNLSGTFCEGGTQCDYSSSVCVAVPTKGQACTTSGAECDEPYDCVGGSCALPNPALCP